MTKAKIVAKAVLSALKSQPARKAEATLLAAVVVALAKAFGVTS